MLIFPNTNLGKIALDVTHPPLGLAYLAAILEQDGHDVFVIDAAALNLKMKKLIARVKEINPAIIGITTNVSAAYVACLTSRELRRNGIDVPIIFGGPWASVEFKFALENKFADFVVLGEGEDTFIKLLDLLDSGKEPCSLKGVSCLRDDEVITSGFSPHVKDLDAIPFPAWHLFPNTKKYFYSNRYFPFYPVLSSRGCPFGCIFCTKVIHGYKMRYRSVENVIDELLYLKKEFKVKEIIFADDNFTLDISRAEQIFDEIHDKNLNIKIMFSNGIRSDIYTEQMVAKMKRAGVYRVFLGIESGNQEVVDKIGKSLTLSKIKAFVRLLKRHGMDVYGYFMLGLPFDTFNTMLDTINFALRLGIKPHFHKTIAVPGTKLHDLVKNSGVPLKNIAKEPTFYNKAGASFEMYPGQEKELNRALKYGYMRYYLSPRGFLSTLKETRTWAEFRWLFHSFLHVANLF
ncbi:MAG: B12-binding domain-containing radical SAM protein [Promethearchaeota archaeon]